MKYHGLKTLMDFGIDEESHPLPIEINRKKSFNFFTYPYEDPTLYPMSRSYGISNTHRNEILLVEFGLTPQKFNLVLWHEYLHLMLPIPLESFEYYDLYNCFPSMYDTFGIDNYKSSLYNTVAELCVIVMSTFSNSLDEHISNIKKFYNFETKEPSILQKVINIYTSGE